MGKNLVSCALGHIPVYMTLTPLQVADPFAANPILLVDQTPHRPLPRFFPDLPENGRKK